MNYKTIIPLVTLALMPFVNPTKASDSVSIKAQFHTVVNIVQGPPFLEVVFTGTGSASHLGKATTASIEEIVDFTLPVPTATGSFITRAANGDILIWDMTLSVSATPDGVFTTFEGVINVVGGTGRFANATGTAFATGSAQLTAPGSGFGEFSFEGTISYSGQ